MKRKTVNVAIVFFVCSASLVAQELRLDAAANDRGDSGYHTQWDSTHNRFLMYRDISSPEIPAAKIFRSDGSSVPIFLLRDFRDATYVDIWAAAATPDGGMVLSVILGFGNRPNPRDQPSALPALKSLLLTYGPDGALKKVWNVEPYMHEALAVDVQGNIFALGVRDAGPEGFPMLIKYSHSGAVLGEYIPSKMFANGIKALDPSSLNGSPALLIRNQKLILWLSSTREAFRFSLNGELQRRIPVGQMLDRVAKKNGFAQATIAALAATDSGDLQVQVRLWPSTTSIRGLVVGMATVSADGSGAQLVGPVTAPTDNFQQFLGISDDNRPVFLEHSEKNRALVRKH